MLNVVIFDRGLMGFSLAVHIVLAAIGIVLPLVIITAEFLGIRYKNKYYTVMAKRLAIIFVIFFAVGTASGTLVALNLLLLWPKFMALVSQVAILPVYLEVFVFFLESIFLGIYFYSWDKFKNKYLHLLTGIPIIIGSALSGVLITMLNAFMNTPAGFNIQNYLATGAITNINPLAVFNTPSTYIEISHVISTIYFAGSFIFIAYASFMLLRTKEKDKEKRKYYISMLKILLIIAIIAVAFSIVTGIKSLTSLITLQPEKFAAIEANLYNQTNAPERLFGLPVNGTLKDYLPIPNLQSILATGSPNGEVPGLSAFPRSTWPPLIIHDLFDLMVFFGFGIGFVLLIILILWLRKSSNLEKRSVLIILFLSGIMALILLEAGWIVDELGRQPWIIYNVMLVSQAANYSTSIIPISFAILLFYIFVIPFTLIVIVRIFKNRKLEEELRK
jgi:cytochrome bd ubiquinol oxidase subunit I